MNAFKFLSLLEVILTFKDIDNPDPKEKIELLKSLEIEKELKFELFKDEKQFDSFYKKFLEIHLPEIPEEKLYNRKQEEENRENFFNNALQILIYSTSFINPDILTIANNYTWRFINKCVNQITKSSKKTNNTHNTNDKGEQVIKREITRSGVQREIVRLN